MLKGTGSDCRVLSTRKKAIFWFELVPIAMNHGLSEITDINCHAPRQGRIHDFADLYFLVQT